MVTPNALTATAIGDLVQTTLRDLGRGRFTDISSTLQKHTGLRHLVRKNRLEFQSGTGVQWDVMVGLTNSAVNNGLGAPDVVNDVDVMTQATADWRNSSTNYSIIGQVMAMNREPSRIVEFVKVKRIAAMISLAELMEKNIWGPPVSSTDYLTPWGLNTWFVKGATQGFNGGAPTGYTSIGLNPTTYVNWQNWTDQYTTVSRDDFIRRARHAATFVDFQPSVDGIPTFQTSDEYGYYTNYGVYAPLEEALESQNENLGDSVNSQDGRVHFCMVPVTWVPYLEADTTNPFYGVHWGTMKTIILQGWWLKETHIPNYPGQHTINAHFMDMTYQFVTHDRRRNFVIATGTTYPQ